MKTIFREDDFKDIPALYEQEDLSSEAIVHLKVNIPFTGYTWLLTEYSPTEKIFFGFACLNDPEMAELGYISEFEFYELACKYPVTIEKLGNITLAKAKKKYIYDEDEEEEIILKLYVKNDIGEELAGFKGTLEEIKNKLQKTTIRESNSEEFEVIEFELLADEKYYFDFEISIKNVGDGFYVISEVSEF